MMFVRMTTFGYWATLALCAKDEAIHEALSEHERLSPKRVMVEAPYAAWKFAYRRLYDTNFGPRGARRVYGQTAVRTALQTITKELNYIDTHPAMQGLGMFGIQTETFPVWKIIESPAPGGAKSDTSAGGLGNRALFKYSPYPLPGHRFCVLVPKHENRDGVKFTWWVERESTEGRLSHKAVHEALWRREIA